MLETVIALAILSLALMAVFDVNSNAIRSHVLAKRLTVATLLARSKMTDLEQKLYDQGLPADDEEDHGDFADEGWPAYKWKAKILAPKTAGLSPDKIMSALFNIPTGGGAGSGGGLGALFGQGSGSSPPGGASGAAAAAGPLAGMAQQQFSQMVNQISQAVREVHLTLSWKEGNSTDTLDVVTHVVSLGPGSDRNGGALQNQLQNANAPSATGYMNPRTGMPVATPVPCASNPSRMCDPADPNTVLVPGAPANPTSPTAPRPLTPSPGLVR